MRTTNDVIRTAAGAAAGLVAVGAVGFAFATLGHAAWLDPLTVQARFGRAGLPLDLAGVGVAALTFAYLYARWFDALLTGPAVLRGLKFGLIAFAWTTGLALLVRELDLAHWSTAHPMLLGLAVLAAWSAFGAVVGMVYGAGRRYHEYRWGLGYGLPDRRSIV